MQHGLIFVRMPIMLCTRASQIQHTYCTAAQVAEAEAFTPPLLVVDNQAYSLVYGCMHGSVVAFDLAHAKLRVARLLMFLKP